ncbi:MAG: glycosyltransferase family 2 protein [Deltaproteobacteria bacterium]|nr:glycosyltransferase family 2 protein [Deltaproteobacteria bacterium]
MKANKKLISIVIPMYNEEEVISETYTRLCVVIKEASLACEIIFVDDSSTDTTFSVVSAIASRDKRVKVIRFSRNFGHQAALSAGLESAKGDAVISMDADLQHPPEIIPKLISKWCEGYEVVYTVREYDKNTGVLKRLTSSLFYSVISRLARFEIPAGGADFRLYDRKAVATINALQERSRFLRGLSAWVGFRQTSVNYMAGVRAAGESKYTAGRMLGLAIDGITSFSIFPLKISIYLGFTVSFLSFFYLCYVLYVALLTDEAVQGWASTTVTLLFLGGVQLIAIGILGEYIGRIYEEIKRRPTYIVTERLGFKKDDKQENKD